MRMCTFHKGVASYTHLERGAYIPGAARRNRRSLRHTINIKSCVFVTYSCYCKQLNLPVDPNKALFGIWVRSHTFRVHLRKYVNTSVLFVEMLTME